jgi:hypothetical protein
VPADHRVEGAGGDGVEDLRDQAEKAEVGGTVAGGPVAVELRLLGLREDVEPEAEVLLVGQAVHGRRVPVDRELEGGLDREVGVPPSRGLDVHDDRAALRSGLSWGRCSSSSTGPTSRQPAHPVGSLPARASSRSTRPTRFSSRCKQRVPILACEANRKKNGRRRPPGFRRRGGCPERR